MSKSRRSIERTQKTLFFNSPGDRERVTRLIIKIHAEEFFGECRVVEKFIETHTTLSTLQWREEQTKQEKRQRDDDEKEIIRNDCKRFTFHIENKKFQFGYIYSREC